MKKFYTILPLLFAVTGARAQCSAMNISVPFSDTTQIQLYHPGFFLLDSGYANVCDWTVTTFDGTVVHQATTSGLFPDQSFTDFTHSVPITDSMLVNLVITNPVTNTTCALMDTLFWEETEVLPGSFIGNWAILSTDGGIATGLPDPGSIGTPFVIYPIPATDHLFIAGMPPGSSLSFCTLDGTIVVTRSNVANGARVELSDLASGVYIARSLDERGRLLGAQRIVKL